MVGVALWLGFGLYLAHGDHIVCERASSSINLGSSERYGINYGVWNQVGGTR